MTSTISESGSFRSKQVRVRYFAVLRERSGVSEEVIDTLCETPATLYQSLQSRYDFRLPASLVKVAVNSEFSDWDAVLRDGDQVVFIPPVAGG